jgi:protein-tyrosine phosphatase
VSRSETFIDTHCHLLPGVDDGATTWEDALVMARAAVADGISTAIVTPHQLGTNRDLDGPTIRAKTAHLQQYLNQHDVPLGVLPGAEVRIEPDLVAKIREGEVLTLADRGRYVLLELPHEIYLPLDEMLRGLRRAGLIGILAHVERNQGVLAQPAVIQPLLDAGCLLQVTAASITGSFGPHVQKLAERLIEQGQAQLVATDAHGVNVRRPQMQRAFQRTVELAGYRAACDLFRNHPAAIVNDRPLGSCTRTSSTKRPGLGRWLPWNKAG